MAAHRVSVTNETVSVTDKLSVTDKNVTVNNETRSWLIQQFEDEGKPPDEISNIMAAQDDYYRTRGHYFIPARMIQRNQA